MVLYRSAGVWLEFVYVQTNFHLDFDGVVSESIIVISGFKMKVSLEANKSKRYACQAIIHVGDCEFIALYCDLCAVLLQVAENFKLKGMC